MPVADFAQPLQIAFRRRIDADGAGDRLDDDGRDGRGVVQIDDALEFVGQVDAVLRLAPAEGVAGEVQRVRQVVHARQQHPERLAVVLDAADGGAAETDAVIAARPPDEAGPLPLAARPVPGDGDLQRRVHRLRAGVGEEHRVHAGRRDLHDARRQLERRRMPHLEGRREVHRLHLALHGLDDGLAAMAGIDAPEPGGGVEHAPAVAGDVVHALGADDQARVRLEAPVRRERHEERFEIVGVCVGERSGGRHGRTKLPALFRPHHSRRPPPAARRRLAERSAALHGGLSAAERHDAGLERFVRSAVGGLDPA